MEVLLNSFTEGFLYILFELILEGIARFVRWLTTPIPRLRNSRRLRALSAKSRKKQPTNKDVSTDQQTT